MWSDGLWGWFKFFKSLHDLQVCPSAQVDTFVFVPAADGLMLSIRVWVSSHSSIPTFTIPQDLAESWSSSSYLILQELAVCRYHTALHSAGFLDISQHAEETAVIWVMLIEVEWSYPNAIFIDLLHPFRPVFLGRKHVFLITIWHPVSTSCVFVTIMLSYLLFDWFTRKTRLVCTE